MIFDWRLIVYTVAVIFFWEIGKFISNYYLSPTAQANRKAKILDLAVETGSAPEDTKGKKA